MQNYSQNIALIKNSRGIYDLDTIKGCFSGTEYNKNGCYNECYALKSAKRYGYNFCKSVLRNFKSIEHLESTVNQIEKIDMPFIRIGVSGDPSENWKHTIRIINLIRGINKSIVIITKHWNILTSKQLDYLSKLNVCVNTSVSAFDNVNLLQNKLGQYKRIKDYCKSILRIVSCDFNRLNLTGLYYSDIQNELLNNNRIIDTVFRPSKNNLYVKMKIINIKKVMFISKKIYASVYNNETYLGYCKDCPEMCGININ